MNSKTLSILSLAAMIGWSCHAASFTTKDGTIYENVTSQRVDVDGIYLEYTIAGGGFGASKIRFDRLSDEQRKQFGYDEAKVKEHDAEYGKMMTAWVAEQDQREKEANERAAAQKEQATRLQTLENDRLASEARLAKAKAELAAQNSTSYANGFYPGGGYYGGDGGYNGNYSGRYVRAFNERNTTLNGIGVGIGLNNPIYHGPSWRR